MQVSRLLEIIYILLTTQRVTAKELAERFEVSTRTIYRDVDVIGQAGIPIYTEKGSNGGISLLPEFVLSKSMFSEKEQTEMLSALQGLVQAQGMEMDQVLQKLSAIFNKAAVKWMEVDFSYWGHEKGYLWSDFKTAILERRIAEFDYYSTYSEKTRRSIEPIQLYFRHKAWYLKGFCLTRGDIRTFKLTRIKNFVVTNKTFPERDLQEVTPNPDTPARQKPNITLKLRIAPEMAYRVLDEFAGDTVEQEPDGSYLVTAICPEDNWVYSMALSFGEYAEVLEPKHVREIVREKAKKIIQKYL